MYAHMKTNLLPIMVIYTANDLRQIFLYIIGAIIVLCNNPVTPLIRAPDKWVY